MVDNRDAFNTQSLRAYLESGEDFTPPDFEDYLINMADASIITINHSDVGHKHKSRDRRCNSFPRAKRRVPTVLGQYTGSTWAVLGQHSSRTRAVLGQYSGSTLAVLFGFCSGSTLAALGDEGALYFK